MTIDLRSTILDSDDIDRETLHVPQWDVDVEVRGMNGKQRAGFVQQYADNDGKLQYDKLYPELIIAGIFDPETSKAVFSDADRDLVMAKSGAALEMLATKVMSLSGLGDDSDADAVGKDGSSKEPESDGSTSSSPIDSE